MSRLLLLACVALLPVAVAAPVPTETRPEFGTSGILTAADLEKVRFDSRIAKEGKEAADTNPPINQKSIDVAVHMPWTKFREGEPVPAYFVLKNKRAETLRLGSRMDFLDRFPHLQGGECWFDIRNKATGESVVDGLAASTNCGGGSLVDVPAKGFWVVKADLSVVSEKPLPAGEYEVDWRYGRVASAPVAFTVGKGDGRKPVVPKHKSVHFFHLTEGGEYLREFRYVDEPVRWQESELQPTNAEKMVAALGVGQNGVYIPDVRTIPSADKLVEASLEWRPYRSGDRLAVTLRAAPPHKEVKFRGLPQLYLQIESDGENDYRVGERKDAQEHALDIYETPLTIEVRLPPEWREESRLHGSARVAVMLTAKELEFPRGRHEELQKALQSVEKVRKDDEQPVWGGIVRTPFVDLQFPSPPPSKRGQTDP